MTLRRPTRAPPAPPSAPPPLPSKPAPPLPAVTVFDRRRKSAPAAAPKRFVTGTNIEILSEAQDAFLVMWTSTTSGHRGTEATTRRLLTLLAAKKKRHEVVYLDLAPQRRSEYEKSGARQLPALTMGGRCHGPYEYLQELEDAGRLDALLGVERGGAFVREAPEAPSKRAGVVVPKLTPALPDQALAEAELDPPEDKIDKAGFLLKKAKLKSGKEVWKERYFLIRGQLLSCFADETSTDDEALASIDLLDVDLHPPLDDIGLTLVVKTSRATIKLQAPHAESCQAWEAAIRLAQRKVPHQQRRRNSV
ncbi:hypothetical protein CTAYLR_009289 [Chrysophaeum taylorii]|uniref:PH domain-containing protein n=1 Tax=Chrysophaeum taylorii TaxID=2483200 RepID=A0AAD7XPR2_9STRA|nr:hypothetical protein CTAYLR_009289 [Chrysophaeum taylorii]